jgi:ketosteroid isomerase-like protein
MHQNAHMEVLAASQNWIAGFNRGDLAAMVRGYTKNASMHPRPNPLCLGQAEIESFWSGLLGAGASELVYSNIRLTIEGEGRARLAADWSMNVAAGVITNEVWIKQENGQWLIAQDDFDILRQSTGSIAEFVSQFHANLTSWFTGANDSGAGWSALKYACPDNMVLVYPSGAKLSGAEFVQSISNHPRNNAGFLATVEQIQVLSESTNEGLVAYVEVQAGAEKSTAENRRSALAMVQRGPLGWCWRYIQETSLG